MKTSPGVLFALAALLAAPAATWPADEAGPATPMAPEAAPPRDDVAPPRTDAVPPKVEPAPPRTPPPPPEAGAKAPEAQPTPPGQWVYTQQYGWVWMPYADSYTWVPPDGYGQPHMYLYYPAYGWTWVVAPWVWGWGPWPYFGALGPSSFAWYGYGWWRYPRYWQYTPPYRGYPYPGVRPAPAPLRPPAIRGAAPYRGAWAPPRAGAGRGGVATRGWGGGTAPRGRGHR